MNTEDTEEKVEIAQELTRDIEKMLAGKGPEVQGAVLAELAAIFIAGHHPDLRDQQLILLAETIYKLVDPISKIKFGSTGWPVPLNEAKAWTN